jgi:hypothetical protein
LPDNTTAQYIFTSNNTSETRQCSFGSGTATVKVDVKRGGITASATTKVTAYSTSSYKFSIGDNVTVTANKLLVRSTPSGKKVGSEKRGNHGSVIGGPVQSKGYVWWLIDYDQNPDGWSADIGLDSNKLSTILNEKESLARVDVSPTEIQTHVSILQLLSGWIGKIFQF